MNSNKKFLIILTLLIVSSYLVCGCTSMGRDVEPELVYIDVDILDKYIDSGYGFSHPLLETSDGTYLVHSRELYTHIIKGKRYTIVWGEHLMGYRNVIDAKLVE